MADYKYDRQALAEAAEWEGGIIDLLEYGVDPKDLDPSDTELVDAWTRLDLIYALIFEPARRTLIELLYGS